ncbi:hypothetical protein ACPA9J_19075 [Pseudomonas aeruginosa]
MRYADFNGPGERSWKIQYRSQPGLPRRPGLAIRRRLRPGSPGRPDQVDPDSAGYGYLYNPNGKNALHWERDLSLLRLPRRPGQEGPQRDLRWSHPPPRQKAAPPRQHPRQLQLRRIPGGGRLPGQVAPEPTEPKKKIPHACSPAAHLRRPSPPHSALEARADAVMLPPLALGSASFMDGVSTCPGMLLELPLQYVRAERRQRRRRAFRFPVGPAVSSSSTLLPHFATSAQNTLLGAHYSAEVLLPLVRLDLDIDGGPDGPAHPPGRPDRSAR